MVMDDRRGMDKMLADFSFWDDHTLRVGILSNPDVESPGLAPNVKPRSEGGRATDLTVGQIAIIHELGLGNMPDDPPRSFMAATIEHDSAQIENDMGEFIGQVFAGAIDAEQAMGFLGLTIIELQKTRIKNRIPPPLSEERRKQKIRAGKRGDTPLFHFGQLINSMRYEIHKGDD